MLLLSTHRCTQALRCSARPFGFMIERHDVMMARASEQVSAGRCAWQVCRCCWRPSTRERLEATRAGSHCHTTLPSSLTAALQESAWSRVTGPSDQCNGLGQPLLQGELFFPGIRLTTSCPPLWYTTRRTTPRIRLPSLSLSLSPSVSLPPSSSSSPAAPLPPPAARIAHRAHEPR